MIRVQPESWAEAKLAAMYNKITNKGTHFCTFTSLLFKLYKGIVWYTLFDKCVK